MPWNQEQSEFLEKFYQGVVDPDSKLSMLSAALGREIGNFYMTRPENNRSNLSEGSQLQVPVATKITCLEHELLVHSKLLVPEYH